MGASRGTRTVGLDKPCRICGKPIHYTYSGPVEGVCGRCVDRRRPRRKVRAYHRGMVVHRDGLSRRPTRAAVAVRVCVVLALGTAAVLAALRYLLG